MECIFLIIQILPFRINKQHDIDFHFLIKQQESFFSEGTKNHSKDGQRERKHCLTISVQRER